MSGRLRDTHAMCSDECIAQERGHILFVPEGARGVDLRERCKGGVGVTSYTSKVQKSFQL